MEINMKDLEEMSAMGFDDVRMEDVPAFGDIRPDLSLSPEERVKKMMASGKNPYFRKTRDGKVLVKISFSLI